MKLQATIATLLLISLSRSAPCFTVPIAPVLSGDRAQVGPAQAVQFLDPKQHTLPSQTTEVRLRFDATNLYVAFRCAEDHTGKLATAHKERDSAVWEDDSVEVFICPGGDRKAFFHIIVNASGAVYDEKDAAMQPTSWDGDWTAQTAIEGSAWTATLTIPWKSLGVEAPTPGTTWLANFCRNETPHGERSCWAPVLYMFGEPERFGKIVFAAADSVTATADCPPITAPGTYTANLTINNPTAESAQLRVVVSVSESAIREATVQAAPGVSKVPVEFNVDTEGNRTLHIATHRKSDGSPISISPGVPVRIPERRAQLANLRAVLDTLRSAPAADRAQARRLVEEAESLAKAARGDAAWTELGERIAAAKLAVERLRYRNADRSGTGYALGTASSMDKVRKDAPYWGNLGGRLRVDMPRNDYEAAQLVLVAYGRPLDDVSIAIGKLTGPSGATMPPDAVACNLVDYVKTRQPVYDVSYVGWHPDPLMPMREFSVAKGEIRPVWITVRAPEGTPAGLYTGKITVKPANAPTQTLPVEVRVRDFALPKQTHLKNAFAFFETELEAWYGKVTPQMRRDYYAFLLQRRLNPTNIYSATPAPSKFYIPECVSGGMDMFNLGPPDEKTLTNIRDYEPFLKQHGWWDMAYVYGWDEVQPANYQAAHDSFAKIKRAYPDLKTMCTVVPNETLDDVIDIWVPITPAFDRKLADAYEARGDQVWWYICCGPGHPFANWFVDYSAVEPRLLFWMNWKYHVPGFLYYALNMWESNRKVDGLPPYLRAHDDPAAAEAIKGGKRWPEVPWNTFTYDRFNGDGHLIYPGPDGEPISSIRLECIRDGIEDYECLYRLNELAKSTKADPATVARARKALAVREDVVKSLKQFTYDPQLVQQARTEILDLIETLEKQ